MTLLTLNNINQIIDSIDSARVKAISDNIYTKTVKEVGANNQFKVILDGVFDNVLKRKIESLKDSYGTYFDLSRRKHISVKDVYDVMQSNKYFTSMYYSQARCNGKVFTAAISYTIEQSLNQAFVEKLAEYIGVDVSNVTNKA